MLDAYLVNFLLGVPLADDAVVQRFSELADNDVREALITWIRNCESVGWIGFDTLDVDSTTGNISVKLNYPEPGILTLHVRPPEEELNALAQRLLGGDRSGGCHVLVSPANPGIEKLAHAIGAAGDEGFVIVDDNWAAAMIVEQMRPLLFTQTAANYRWRSSWIPAAPYFVDKATGLDNVSIKIQTSSSRAQSLANILAEDTTVYEERLRHLKRESATVEGTILLASVFLPPITHCRQAIERFYDSALSGGYTSLQLIRERYAWEHRQFIDHIRRFRRIDIIDREALVEYLHAPEYYQMALTADELLCQIERIIELLEYENYLMCLCPESIGFSFEVRDGKVRVRADRRHKSSPRQGRISSLTFDNPIVAEVFEREFWTLFRLTEDEFKDKNHIRKWLVKEAANYKGE